jgi:hypothetical protein
MERTHRLAGLHSQMWKFTREIYWTYLYEILINTIFSYNNFIRPMFTHGHFKIYKFLVDNRLVHSKIHEIWNDTQSNQMF